MKNQLAVAVDTGKDTTKSAFYEGNTLQTAKFKTRVREVQDLGIEIPQNNYLVDFGKKSYLIGQVVGEDKTQSTYDMSKHSLEHLLCIYLAITKVMERLSNQNHAMPLVINLAVNVPVNIYKNKQLLRDYSSFILNDYKTIFLRVNEKEFSFKIGELLLLPEGTGPIYSHLNEFRHKRVFVCDIGSLNVNFGGYHSLTPNLNEYLISNQGIYSLRSQITEQLSSKYGIFISTDDGEQILRDGCLMYNGAAMEDSKVIIKNAMLNHVKEIMNFIKSRGISLNNTTLLFTGGGSKLLRKTILREIPSAIIDSEGQFSNVLSFMKVMEAKGFVS